MGLESWSTTAASNNASPPDGAPEGMAPSAVNDVIREVMAQVRTWYEDPSWIDLGYTVTQIDSDTFRIAADVTATFKKGRRIKLFGSTMSTVYGTIAASSFSSPNTDIDVNLDSGSLDSSLSQVWLSALADGQAFPPNIRRTTLYGNASASATDAFNLTFTYDIDELTAGLEVTFLVPEINTGACTLDVQGLGAKNILNADLTALDAGDLRAGGIVTARYDGSAFVAIAGILPDKVGTIKPWTTDTAPNGWLLCDGSEVSRTTYNALFKVISTTYGVGDGGSTFNLPDLRGRTIVGQDDMGGTAANRITDSWADALGSAGGSATHTLTIGEIPAHTHSYNHFGGASGSLLGSGNADVVSATSGSTGGGGAHANIQPSFTLNYVIRT